VGAFVAPHVVEFCLNHKPPATKLAKVVTKHFTVHDLRRSFASLADAYERHPPPALVSECRDAWAAWGERMTAIAASIVVALGKRQRA
jgi:hypothetical protein